MNGVYWDVVWKDHGACVFPSRRSAEKERKSIWEDYPKTKVKIRRIKMSDKKYKYLEEHNGW